MLDALSLDQMRTFVAAVDEGNFSAAGRKLLRAQSVISQTIANLEEQLEVELFDRQGRYPKLTRAGEALISDARAIISAVDAFRAKARGISAGVEPELSIVVDVMFPIYAVSDVAKEFIRSFPSTTLRIRVGILGEVAKSVLDGESDLGVIGSLPDAPDRIRAERLLGVRMVMVAAPSHPLAAIGRPLSPQEVAVHTQLVLTDPTDLSEGRNFGVLSSRTWRLDNIGAKRQFLLDGLGWGAMPIVAIESDLKAGSLVRIEMEDTPGGIIIPISVVYRTESPPGPAGRWFIEKLKECSMAHEANALTGP